jgi:hypothetical protein
MRYRETLAIGSCRARSDYTVVNRSHGHFDIPVLPSRNWRVRSGRYLEISGANERTHSVTCAGDNTTTDNFWNAYYSPYLGGRDTSPIRSSREHN